MHHNIDIAEKQIADAESQKKRRDHAHGGDQKRRQPDLAHFLHAGFEADLEQQQHDADFSQRLQHDIVPNEGPESFPDAKQSEVAQHNAKQQFSEHGGLLDPFHQIAAQFGKQKENQNGQEIALNVLRRLAMAARRRRSVAAIGDGIRPGGGCRIRKSVRRQQHGAVGLAAGRLRSGIGAPPPTQYEGKSDQHKGEGAGAAGKQTGLFLHEGILWTN